MKMSMILHLSSVEKLYHRDSFQGQDSTSKLHKWSISSRVMVMVEGRT
jgi:hypothetical protein